MRNLPGSQGVSAKNIEPDTVYSIEKNKYEIRMVHFSIKTFFLRKMVFPGPVVVQRSKWPVLEKRKQDGPNDSKWTVM